jgi:uncharacterized protein YbaP (TraB family)
VHVRHPGDARRVAGRIRSRRRAGPQPQDAALPLLAKGNTFIGVGALHLPGRDGLVQLLRDKGFTVTTVE